MVGGFVLSAKQHWHSDGICCVVKLHTEIEGVWQSLVGCSSATDEYSSIGGTQ